MSLIGTIVFLNASEKHIVLQAHKESNNNKTVMETSVRLCADVVTGVPPAWPATKVITLSSKICQKPRFGSRIFLVQFGTPWAHFHCPLLCCCATKDPTEHVWQ